MVVSWLDILKNNRIPKIRKNRILNRKIENSKSIKNNNLIRSSSFIVKCFTRRPIISTISVEGGRVMIMKFRMKN